MAKSGFLILIYNNKNKQEKMEKDTIKQKVINKTLEYIEQNEGKEVIEKFIYFKHNQNSYEYKISFKVLFDALTIKGYTFDSVYNLKRDKGFKNEQGFDKNRRIFFKKIN